MKPLIDLSRALAINYYNVSISEFNSDYKSFSNRLHERKHDFKLNQIFKIAPNSKKVSGFSELGYSRNILIIGSGASKDVCPLIPDANGAINQVQSELGLPMLLFNSKELTEIEHRTNQPLSFFANNKNFLIAQKYIQLASHYLEKIYNDDNTFDDIFNDLSFEGGLQILMHFYKKEDILKKIQEKINFRYLPSQFYEIVAHLFKHRFIDIIVNFNFDELLDNAIEDEMGDTFYYRIARQADCIDFDKIIGNNRLRIPLYIKPHGTISDINSLLFTKEQYIDLASDIRKILIDLFSGKSSSNIHPKSSSEPIKQFNVICAGTSLRDMDMNSILFNHIKSSVQYGKNIRTKTSIYVIDINAKEVVENFRLSFRHWLNENIKADKRNINTSNRIKETQKAEAERSEKVRWYGSLLDNPTKNDSTKHMSVIPIECSGDDDGADGIGLIIAKLYEAIRSHFNEPFSPPNLLRHRFVTTLFPKQKFNDYISENQPKKWAKFLFRRGMCYLLLDFIKQSGNMPTNAFTHDRPSKYYSEYIKLLSQSGLLNDAWHYQPKFDNLVKDIKYSDKTITHEDFYRTCYPKPDEDEFNRYYKMGADPEPIKIEVKRRDEYINNFVNELLVNPENFSLLKGVNTATLKGTLIKLLRDIIYSGSYEINASHDDKQHHLFFPFHKDNIINTNLELSWSFFEYAVLNMDKWDTLCLSSNTGIPLYNLYRYFFENDPKLFKKFNSRSRHIKILHSIKFPLTFSADDKEHAKGIPIIPKLKFLYNETLFGALPISEGEKGSHQMALFLKEEKPVYGIYYFKADKVRINPVYFLADEKFPASIHNLDNLKTKFDCMWEMAKEHYDRTSR